MEIIASIKPLLAVLISFCAPLFIIALRKNANVREGVTFSAAIIKFALIASMIPGVLNGQMFEWRISEVLPGVGITLRADPFGLLFAIVASFLWIVTSAYSIGYMRGLKEHAQTRYFSFFSLSLSAAVGVAFSGNLFTMYLFYEMLSISTYPLVTHHQDEEARTSGRKYLLYIVGASIAFALPAMLYVYHLAGTLDFISVSKVMNDAPIDKTALSILLLLFMFGFAKAAVMPLHSWLPAAMVAPTPVSALLHAVAVVKVGVFSIFRIFSSVLGPDLLNAYDLGTLAASIASITIITASLVALSQDGLKRRLAFSTIGQLSYIVLGAALLSPNGMIGGMLHIAMHAFGKITLFFCAGAIFVTTGKKNVSELVGIGKRMPITMGAFFIGALSVIGLPPTGGFISKWYLITGAVQADKLAFLFVILFSSFLNAVYFLPIVYKAFFCTKEESLFSSDIKEAPLFCLWPPVFAAFCSIVLFFYPQPFLWLAKLAFSYF